MSEALFCDTNVLIRLLNGDGQVYELLNGRLLYVSVVTEMELQCKPDSTVEELKLIRSLLDDCRIISLSDQVKDNAIQIRRTARLKLLDAIVAASAVTMQLPLVTGDLLFERVTDTSIILLPPVS